MSKRKPKHSSEEANHLFVKKDLSHEEIVEQVKEKKHQKKSAPSSKEAIFSVHTPEAGRHIDQQLAEIYGNSDGTIPDMRHFEIRKRHRLLTAILVLCVSFFVLAAVAWVGFFVMKPGGSFVEEDVILSVSGNDKAVIGQEVQFRIRYKNAGSSSLAKASIQAHYPEGFMFESASVTPTGDGNDEWAIGSLNKDDGGYIDITGRMYGDISTEHSVRVFMNYTPGNFTSEFQKVAYAVIALTESPVEIIIDTPTEIFQGIEAPIKITVKKRLNIDVPPGKLTILLDPQGIFTKQKSEPKSDAFDQYQWTIDTLGGEKTITVSGVFSLPDGKKPEFSVSVMGQPTAVKDKKFIYAEQAKTVALASAEVTVQSVVNGSTTQLHVQPGEKLIARIVARNNGTSILKNAKVRLQLDVPAANNVSIIDWANIVDQADGDIQKGEKINDTTRRGQIIWTEKHISELNNLAPGKEIALDIEIPIKSGSVIDLSDYASFRGEFKAELQYEAGDTVQTLSGNPIEIIFQSDVSVDADRTQEGNAAHLSWTIKNSFHELKNVQIKAEFFGDVSPDGGNVSSPPAGTATFDQKTKMVTWSIPTMPTTVDVLSYEFIINTTKVNPSQTQLTSKIQFEATDAVTGEKILKVLDAIPLN